MSEVRVIAVALASGMWVFQLYSAFLPEYFQTIRGLTLEQSGNLRALILFVEIFAAVAAGQSGILAICGLCGSSFHHHRDKKKKLR